MMDSDKKSWQIKDEAVYEELVGLMGLSSEEITSLSALHDAAESESSALAAAFYERLLGHENTKEYFEGIDIDHMRKATAKWFADLFCGNYDASYVHQRMEIGKIHVRIGLPVRYPLAMLDIISNYGEKVTAGQIVALQAFNKVLALDVAIFNQAYEDNQLKHLTELVGGERLARRLLTGNM